MEMKKAFVLLWHGITGIFSGIADWFTVILGMRDDSKYGRFLRRVVGSCFALIMLFVTSAACVGFFEAIKKHLDDERLCFDDTSEYAQYLSRGITYYDGVYGKDGYVKDSNGEKDIKVNYQETELSTYKTVKKDIYLYCDASTDAMTKKILEKSSFKLNDGKEEINIDNDIEIPVSIRTIPIRDIVIEEYYSKNFTEIIENVENKYIYLAKFHIVSNQLTYFIESFEKHPFNQYLFSNELISLLQEIGGDSKDSPTVNKETIKKNETVPQVMDLPEPKADNIVTGVERINLGFNPKVGKSYYSYGFVHGLGEGNVAVVTAIDNKANYLTDERGLLVFGDKDIFTKEEISISAPNVTIGACVSSR